MRIPPSLGKSRRVAPRLPIFRSLRGKGGLFTLLLAAYFVLVSLVVAVERQTMQDSVRLLEALNSREEQLVGLNYAVSRTVISVNENYFAPDVEASGKMLALEVEALLPGLIRLQEAYPGLNEFRAGLERMVVELVSEPTRASIADLRATMHRLVLELDVVTADVAAEKSTFAARYHNAFERLSREWLLFGVVALLIAAGVFKTFFRGLAVDIDRVRLHATRVLRGEPSQKLEHRRRDELGLLMDAVNSMQEELARRDNEIELSRQQTFHKEKMAAVGSLAAAVAHEINNPLSAIVGVAQVMNHECQSTQCGLYGADCHPEMILDQARRVMQITRQISEFSVPQSPEPELNDLNTLLRNTANFVKFDRRFRTVEVTLELDSNLPAVVVVADHVVQVAINLLINAADALHQLDGRTPVIRVQTLQDDGHVVARITDNGSGIPPEVLPRVFEERFTTKGPGHGSGLGLALCRSLIEKAGGTIEIRSTQGVGTEAEIRLPVPALGADCR